MSSLPETPTSSNNDESLFWFSQIKGSAPTEVLNMYRKKQNQTPKSKFLQQKRAAESQKNKRIDDFFGKKVCSRSTKFDTNRLGNNVVTAVEVNKPPSLNVDNEPDIPENVISLAIANAKDIIDEYEKLLDCEDLDTKSAFKVMGKMSKTMLDLIQQLQLAMISKNKASMNTFNERLKTCTSFICNEIEHVRSEIKVIKENDLAECTSIIQACGQDLKKIWIRFAYASDAEELRKDMNPLKIKELLMQMDIPIGTMKFPIESFYFQTKKFGDDQMFPEVALCCTFVNSTIASIVKNGVRNFNSKLKANGQFRLVRYDVASELSYSVRSLLKICNEMKRFNIIEKAFVTNEGIKVYHVELTGTNARGSEYKYSTSFINSFRKLDNLRRQLNDYNSTAPASNVYSDDYFKNSYDERKKMREIFETMDTEEYEMTDEEDINKSIVTTNQ
jgi:hypothetical protein